MVLPNYGYSISMSQMNSEFGAGYSLSSYYRYGSYVTGNDYAPFVPSSGAISFDNFHNAKKNSYNGVCFGSSQYYTISSYNTGYVDVYVEAGGGGGGVHGDYWGGYGGNGGSGVVIISYSGTQRGSGGTVTSSGGYTIHTFTTSGTYTA